MENTDKAVFLCDDSKFNKRSIFKVCDVDDVACMISNNLSVDGTAKYFKKMM